MDSYCNKIKKGLTLFHTFHTNLKAATHLWKVRAGQHALFVWVSKFTVTLLSHIFRIHQCFWLIPVDFDIPLNTQSRIRGKYKEKNPPLGLDSIL